jgi:hypothetical protein
MYQCIVFQFLRTMIYLYEYILNSYFQSLAASFFDIRGLGVSKVSQSNSYVDLEICMTERDPDGRLYRAGVGKVRLKPQHK